MTLMETQPDSPPADDPDAPPTPDEPGNPEGQPPTPDGPEKGPDDPEGPGGDEGGQQDQAEASMPYNLAEAARTAALASLDYRSADGQPILPQPADRDSWVAGMAAGVEAVLRMVPAGDPTSFAIEQLWVHQRWIADAIVKVANGMKRLNDKLDEYEAVLPAPDSLIGRVSRYTNARRTQRAGMRDGG